MIFMSQLRASTCQISVSLKPLPPLPELAASWNDLESRALASFYTSWSWMGVWLEMLPAVIRPELLEARLDGRVVGLAIVVRGPGRKLLGMKCCRTWHLHYTGRPELDVICPEHNDFLMERGHEAAVRTAMLRHWLDQHHGPAEITLFGIGEHMLPAGIENRGKNRFLRKDVALRTYSVDLNPVRDRGGDFLQLLSANSRSLIRRSMRDYRRHGELSVESAGTVGQALEWFDRLGVLHQRRWESRGQPGSFSNGFFVEFHRSLISRNMPTGGIQLLRVRAGNHDLAYLYSLVKDGRVYFYQSGLDYGIVEKNAHPGLVAHVFAIEHNARLGHHVYDFMAGDSQYKRSLATCQQEMFWTTLRTVSWHFELHELTGRLRRMARTILRSGNTRARPAGCPLVSDLNP